MYLQEEVPAVKEKESYDVVFNGEGIGSLYTTVSVTFSQKTIYSPEANTALQGQGALKQTKETGGFGWVRHIPRDQGCLTML